MTGLSDMKWEETDTDTSTSDLTHAKALEIYNLDFQDVTLRKLQPMMTRTNARTDILYLAKTQWTSEDVDLENYAITSKRYSTYWIDKPIDKCLSGMIVLETWVNHSLPDGSLKEEEHITCRLQLTTSNKSSNGFAVDIKGNRISLSTSLEVPSGMNRFTLESKLSRTGSYMTLDMQLSCVTFGDANYWY